MTSSPADNVATLLSWAHQMELDAQERYSMLADQMEAHNNTELAQIFRNLARVEGLHAAEIRQQMQQIGAPILDEHEIDWGDGEAPETVDLGDVDYLMTPHEALQLALKAEQRAKAFFDDLLARASDDEVRRFAREFATEEQEHVALVLEELAKYPATPRPDDPDPPHSPA